MMDIQRPETVSDLSDLIQSARADQTPLEIGGGFTRRIGRPAQVAKRVSTSGINGITLYEPGALTLVAAAGTPLSDIETALDAENQRLAFEPMDHRHLLGTRGEPTLGGVVAGNVSGPRRIQAGACRDALLGVKFVDGHGALISNGGRVMKNVTGYDLTKLLCGSWGTLGVLTEVSLKVLPKPERAATIVLQQSEIAEAITTLSKALGSPFEVTGAAHANGQTLLRVEGLETQVNYRIEKLRDRVARDAHGIEIADGAEHHALWASVRDLKAFAGDQSPVWKVSIKPSDAAPVTAAIRAEAASAEFVYDWGGGLVWVHLPDTPTDGGAKLVRGAIGKVGGHATLIRAPETIRAVVPVFQPEPATLASLSVALRERFDPAGILNPGLMTTA